MRILALGKKLIFLLIILEIAVFILVGNLIGVFATLLLVIASSLLGGAILRNHGLLQLQQLQRRMRSGEHPALPALEHALILLAGLLLIIPGFITSIVGLLLLSSLLRVWLLKFLIKKKIIVTGEKKNDMPGKRVIDGEFWREDDNANKH